MIYVAIFAILSFIHLGYLPLIPSRFFRIGLSEDLPVRATNLFFSSNIIVIKIEEAACDYNDSQSSDIKRSKLGVAFVVGYRIT
jgi:hypothetical protein